MKRFTLFFMIACTSLAANARLVRSISFDEQRNNADLVVIATPIIVKEIAEGTPDFMQHNKLVKVTGVETTFNILTMFKGDTSLKTFVLHHYSVTGSQNNGPNLVSIRSKRKHSSYF